MIAQVTPEFLIVVLAISVFFIVFMTIYQNQLTNLQQTKDKLQAQEAAQRVANAINYVYLAGDGTSYDLIIVAPRSNITARGNFITAEVINTGTLFQFPLIINVTNTTINNSGRIIITNVGGTIAIN